MLVAGHGTIVAEFFDAGESRTLAWGRRPQAAALVAALADPGRGWDAVVIGEYERAFYASQYASMAPLLEHYGVGLWIAADRCCTDCAGLTIRRTRCFIRRQPEEVAPGTLRGEHLPVCARLGAGGRRPGWGVRRTGGGIPG